MIYRPYKTSPRGGPPFSLALDSPAVHSVDRFQSLVLVPFSFVPLIIIQLVLHYYDSTN